MSAYRTKPIKPPVAAISEPPEPPLSDEALDPVLVLTQSDLNILSKYLGRNILTRDDLLNSVRPLASMSIDGTEVILEPRLLFRLRTRCPKGEFGPWLKDTIVNMLRAWVGY